ncbi:MAG TPA: acetyl-CoA carboxylase carboxyl transferase subunit alpha, partial [Chitinophagaceae bacterium]
VPEPDGGAHWDYDGAAEILKNHILSSLEELKQLNPEERIDRRIRKFSKMGFWDEVPEEQETAE